MNYDYLRMVKRTTKDNKFDHHEVNSFWDNFKEAIDKLSHYQIEDYNKRKKK